MWIYWKYNKFFRIVSIFNGILSATSSLDPIKHNYTTLKVYVVKF